MKSKAPKNVAASIRAKLLDRASERKEDFQFMLGRWVAERFLYRLGKSDQREVFVLKGATLFLIWQGKLRPLLKYVLMTLLFFFTVTIGISRIILNVHYTTDVIAGFCLGVMWVILSFWILNLLSGMAVVSKEQPVVKKD